VAETGTGTDWVRTAGERARRALLLPALGRFLHRTLPKRLFPRSLLIIVLPMILLQSVAAYVFLERHWELVTRRLSEATVRDITAIISVLQSYPQDADYSTLTRIARDDLKLAIEVLPKQPLPPPAEKPFFSLLDRTLSRLISESIGKPFWIDTVGRSDFVEIRIDLGDRQLKVYARRSQTYAANAHIFLVWMVGTAFVLLAIAIPFLRNQIRPIQTLAAAAEDFGKGRPVDGFRPRGALEVRQAAHAFLEMRRRIERQIEQRTTMLAGVSHDLRTMLTRFRLELAFLGDGEEVAELKKDVDEMQAMLEGYIAFVRGDGDEQAALVDLDAMLAEIAAKAASDGCAVTARFEGEPQVTVKPSAFRRVIVNLVGNACRHAGAVEVAGRHADGWITVTVDDDGPGVPAEMREEVFKPFVRLDEARNQDQAGTGLGLAIARDIVRGHGGDIGLEQSPLGGLRARVRIPG
jgi:two-component system osmolarity sensor histidine kinase EnvZ